MKLFSLFTDWLYNLLLAACCIGLATMVIIIAAQVFCRFVLNFTPYWTEELTLIIMIYSGFLGAVVAYKKRLHISLQFFINSLPEKTQNWFFLFIDCVLFVFSVFTIVYGWDLTERTMHQFNPALGWPVGTSYIAIPISGFFFLIFTIEKIIEDISNQKIGSREG